MYLIQVSQFILTPEIFILNLEDDMLQSLATLSVPEMTDFSTTDQTMENLSTDLAQGNLFCLVFKFLNLFFSIDF